jgi:N-acetylglucosaminyldiphosphoundecaprenol N-acetyl-beta-D-mannosaminyltransferase
LNNSNSPYFHLLNIRFLNISLNEIVILVLRAKYPTIVVTPNVDHLVRASQDSDIARLYLNADLCINDSRVLSRLISLFLDKKLTSVTGSDLTQHLLAHAALIDKTIAIVGGDTSQITKLELANPKKTAIKHFNPPMQFLSDAQAVQQIQDFLIAAEADFIFLAVGSPQQEKLAHLIKPNLNKGVILCVGASIDYLTGKERRASLWVQQIRMEWFFRFLQAPQKRFRRYFINCPQIFYLLWQERQKLKQSHL